MDRLKILAIEPFYGGSHAAMLDGWRRHSRHEFTLCTLPGRHWKWRMRHAALTLARQTRQLDPDVVNTFDMVFTSDMLDLPTWKGFADPHQSRLPIAIYFHENQWTYPVSAGQALDLHFGYTNFLSAVAADAVWFNSAYHRDGFLTEARRRLTAMPDHSHLEELTAIGQRSRIVYPGIDAINDASYGAVNSTAERPLHIGWVARWEHDKRPEIFVTAIEQLLADGYDFRLILLGQAFREMPACYQRLLDLTGDRVVHRGFAEDRQQYSRLLQQMDVVVSSAAHEFFGIGIAEAASAGAVPIVPRDLAYPELYDGPVPAAVFHDGDAAGLVKAIRSLAADRHALTALRAEASRRTERLAWPKQAVVFDELCKECVT